jgi:hypothetical protein
MYLRAMYIAGQALSFAIYYYITMKVGTAPEPSRELEAEEGVVQSGSAPRSLQLRGRAQLTPDPRQERPHRRQVRPAQVADGESPA